MDKFSQNNDVNQAKAKSQKKKLNCSNKLGRRDFLFKSLSCAMATSLQSLAVGLPSAFLTTGKVMAYDRQAKFTLFGVSTSGESFNCNGPGAYASDNDLAVNFQHPSVEEFGDETVGSIQGMDYSMAGLEKSKEMKLNQTKIHGAEIYSELPQDFMDHLACFYHRTGTDSHAQFHSVSRLQGALKDSAGRVEEELPSAVAQETAAMLGTILEKPVIMGRADAFYEGTPIARYRPKQLKALFSNDSSGQVALESFDQLYASTVDQIYGQLKQTGTPAQRRFLDQNAITRAEATTLGNDLGSLLSDIRTNSTEDQFKAAIALFKLGVSPVVTVDLAWCGDNHNDSNLKREASTSIQLVNTLNQYWNDLVYNNLQDQVNLVTLNVFGRTYTRNESGGRDHFGDATLGFIHGADINGGMVGGLERVSTNKEGVAASGIDPVTGSSSTNGIAATDTLAAYGKTILKAAGVSEERLAVRVPFGQSVESVFGV